jgi:NADPH:quinone reductase-like Zn-dependent oxidoreductase
MLVPVSDLATAGHFHIHIDRTLALKDAAQALDLNRQGHTGGKIILEVSR